MQVSILSGIVADKKPDLRTSYPVNMIPVPKDNGISGGYLRPAEGIIKAGDGPGRDRGAILWNDAVYRVMGNQLVRITETGLQELGSIDGMGPVSMAYSFDNLAIAADGAAWLYDGATLTKYTDTDLGKVFSVTWIDGYFVFTDGTSIISTDLNDPLSINPLHYGSSEINPDAVMAVTSVRNELVAINRYTIEVFTNIGGTGFPFQRSIGGYIPKGCVGHAAQCIVMDDRLAFVGGGLNQPPSVYLAANGQSVCIATREIERLLMDYADLSGVVVEPKSDQGHRLILVHLPDKTLAYDITGSETFQQPIWFVLQSGFPYGGTYRARGHVWAFNRWNVADPLEGRYGYLSGDVGTHWGAKTAWEFSTGFAYSGNSGIVHELELIPLYGLNSGDTLIDTCYSEDGRVWSQPKSVRARGRLRWLQQGMIRSFRAQKFTGSSDAQTSFARLEARVEALSA